MKIRKTTEKDVKKLQNLNDEVFVDNLSYDEDLNTNWAQSDYGKKYFLGVINKPDSICLIAEENERAIGYIAATKKEYEGTRKSNYIEIENMGVSPLYRSQGIGSSLMEECLKIAKNRGFDKVYVNCYFKNIQAVNFYKKMGFEEIDVCLEKKL